MINPSFSQKDLELLYTLLFGIIYDMKHKGIEVPAELQALLIKFDVDSDEHERIVGYGM